MAKGLTQKQHDILDYILSYVDREGFPPSIREIGKDFKIGSLRGVTVHLDALERKGYISRSNLPRSIKVIHPDFVQTNRVAMLPMLGDIAAGDPIPADGVYDESELVAVPISMVRNPAESFVLRIKGDSMVEEGINDEDLVVIRKHIEPRQNELVAVMIDGRATVKRINKTKEGTVFLMASNSRYDPIPIDHDNHQIVGKVVGLIREYRF